MPQRGEVTVIDTIQEIAPGIVEVDEYVVQGESGGGANQIPGMGQSGEEE